MTDHYATIATFWYCPPNVNDVEFKAAIQGHYAILEENNPEQKRSLTASRHYSDYEIADAVIANYGGKRKGINLGIDGVQVINEFRERIENNTALPRIKKKLSSVRIWRDDKPLLARIFERLGLSEPLNQSEKMGQLLQWIKELLEDEPKTSLLEPETIETPETIPEIPLLQDQLISETIITVSSPDALNTANLNESSQPSSQIVTASGLEAKIDKLVDVMTQFISFSMQSSIQPPTTPPTRATVKATTEAKPIITDEAAASGANSSNTITFGKKLDKVGQPSTIQDNYKANELTQKGCPTLSRFNESQQRSTRNSPEAEAAIASAIDAIIAHNNTTELHDLKWAISINAVKELVSEVTKSQRLVDRAIKERKAEIEAHHTQHQLEPSHNHRHKRKRTIRESIPFPSAQI